MNMQQLKLFLHGRVLTAPCALAHLDMPGPQPRKTITTTSKSWNAPERENAIARVANVNAFLASMVKDAAVQHAQVTATAMVCANPWKSLPRITSRMIFTKMLLPSTIVHGMPSTAMDASVMMATVVQTAAWLNVLPLTILWMVTVIQKGAIAQAVVNVTTVPVYANAFLVTLAIAAKLKPP